MKATSLSTDANLRSWKTLFRSPVAVGDAVILPDNNNHVRPDYCVTPAEWMTRPTLLATTTQHKWDLQESLMGLTWRSGFVHSRFKL